MSLQIVIPDVNKLVEMNDLQEVKTPIYFDINNVPTTDGLFSYEIFGKPASYDRKTVFAYIDLKGNYLHPNVYKSLIRINRKFEACITGIKNYKINNNGQLEEDESGDTGIDFLYKNWSKLKFVDSTNDSDSLQRLERTNLLTSLKRDEAFMSKQIVIPCFYRDINFSDIQKGIVSHDVVNDLYAKLLRTVSIETTNTADFGFSFIGHATKKNVQLILMDIYTYFSEKIKGKNGIFRKAVLGKSVDQVGRAVISSSHFNYNTYKECLVQFDYVGVPLYQILKLFFFFIMNRAMTYADVNFVQKDSLIVTSDDGKSTSRYKFAKTQPNFTFEGLKKRIEMFDKAPSSRFDLVTVDVIDEKEKIKQIPLHIVKQSIRYNFKITNPSPDESDSNYDETNEMMTWTDLFYIIAEEVVRDKHVYISRYPLTNYLGTYPSKLKVLSTVKNKVVKMGDTVYSNYPVVDRTLDANMIRGEFIDALQIFNGSIHALGADFDGDQVTIRGVFTQEANAEAEKLIYDKKNILSLNGQSIRGISREGVLALYELTKD